MTGNVSNGRKGPSEANRYVYAMFERLGIAFRGVHSGSVFSSNLVGLKGTSGNTKDDILLDPSGVVPNPSTVETDSTFASVGLGWPHGYPRYWYRPESEGVAARVVVIEPSNGAISQVVFDSHVFYSAGADKEVLAAAAIYDEPVGDKTVERLWVFSYGATVFNTYSYHWYSRPSGAWFIRVFDTKTREQISTLTGSSDEFADPFFPLVSIHPDGTHGIFVIGPMTSIATYGVGEHTVSEYEKGVRIGKVYFDGTFEFSDVGSSCAASSHSVSSSETTSGQDGQGGYTTSGSGSSEASASFSMAPVPAMAEYSDTGELLMAYAEASYVRAYSRSSSLSRFNVGTSTSENLYDENGNVRGARITQDGYGSDGGSDQSTDTGTTSITLSLWDGVQVKTRDYTITTEYSFTQSHSGAAHIEYETTPPNLIVLETYTGSGPGYTLDEAAILSYRIKNIYRIPVFVSLKAKVAVFFVTTQEGEAKNRYSSLHVHKDVSPTYVQSGLTGGVFESSMYGGRPPHTKGHLEVYYGSNVFSGAVADHDAGRDDSDWLWYSETGVPIFAPSVYMRSDFLPGNSEAKFSKEGVLRMSTYGDTYVPLKRYANSFYADVDRTVGSRAVHAVRMGDMTLMSWSNIPGMFTNSTYAQVNGYSIAGYPDQIHLVSHGGSVPFNIEDLVSNDLNFSLGALVAVRRVRPVS